uniref:Uncharacterized protein n=1 Tax=Arundo donax TaxID=35708 RepID=A0A0A8ZUY4_ARUDO
MFSVSVIAIGQKKPCGKLSRLLFLLLHDSRRRPSEFLRVTHSSIL